MDGPLRSLEAAAEAVVRRGNPDAGIPLDESPRSQKLDSNPLPVRDAAEACDIATTIAMTAFSNAPPFTFTMMGARTGNPTAVAVGVALDSASEILSASPALSELVTASLSHVCETAVEAVYERPDSVLGVLELSGGEDGVASAHCGTNEHLGEPRSLSHEVHGEGDSFDQTSLSLDHHDVGQDWSSNGASTSAPSDEWRGGGGDFSGAGASGGWGPSLEGTPGGSLPDQQ